MLWSKVAYFSIIGTEFFRIWPQCLAQLATALGADLVRCKFGKQFSRQSWIVLVNYKKFSAIDASVKLLIISHIWNSKENFYVEFAISYRKSLIASNKRFFHCIRAPGTAAQKNEQRQQAG